MSKFNYINFVTEHKHGLEELSPSNHYITRKTENTITRVFTPMDILGGMYDPKEFKIKLIEAIQNEIDIRLKRLEQSNSIESSKSIDIAYLIMTPTITKGGVSQYVKMEFMYSPKNGEIDDDGNIKKVSKITGAFVVVVSEDVLITYMEIGADMNNAEIEAQVKRHNRRNNPPPYKEVRVMGDPEFIINIDNLMGGERQRNTITIENLPYEVKSDYRANQNIVHDVYGTKKVITTSNGTGGKGGMSGRLDWVEIEASPHVKAGVLIKSIRIPNVYTLSYFNNR